MSSIFKILIDLFLIFSFQSHSANKVGNGGNIVQCKVDGKTKAQLLDFYESETVPKIEGKDAQEIAARALQKIKEVAPKLAAQYSKRLSSMQAEISYKDQIQLLEVPDSKHLFRPLSKDCEVLQIAVRDNLTPDVSKRFLIRRDLWEQLEAVQKAGLLTHEIIHEHLTKLGEENSIKARRINSFLYSDSSKSSDFWKLIRELEIPLYP